MLLFTIFIAVITNYILTVIVFELWALVDWFKHRTLIVMDFSVVLLLCRREEEKSWYFCAPHPSPHTNKLADTHHGLLDAFRCGSLYSNRYVNGFENFSRTLQGAWILQTVRAGQLKNRGSTLGRNNWYLSSKNTDQIWDQPASSLMDNGRLFLGT